MTKAFPPYVHRSSAPMTTGGDESTMIQLRKRSPKLEHKRTTEIPQPSDSDRLSRQGFTLPFHRELAGGWYAFIPLQVEDTPCGRCAGSVSRFRMGYGQ
jgi:hypothetical protein